MIRKPNDPTAKMRYRVLLYAPPGMAKSTTGLSAPKVLLIDADRGWHRIPVQHRTALGYTQPESYAELLQDLEPSGANRELLQECETIVLDTGGSLLNLMKPWAVKSDPANGQRNGQLSQRGYGVVGREFERLVDWIFTGLAKNLVVLFHAREDSDGDVKCYRLDVEGQTRNNVWKPMDLGGFVDVVRDQKIVGFSPTDRYFAKGTHGIAGTVELPNVMKDGVPNDFLTTLFARMDNAVAAEAEIRGRYDAVMKAVRTAVEPVKDEATAAEALKTLGGLEYVFAARGEAWHLLSERCKAVGMKWDPQAKEWVIPPAPKTVDAQTGEAVQRRSGELPL